MILDFLLKKRKKKNKIIIIMFEITFTIAINYLHYTIKKLHPLNFFLWVTTYNYIYKDH